jgi:hypothetical protein
MYLEEIMRHERHKGNIVRDNSSAAPSALVVELDAVRAELFEMLPHGIDDLDLARVAPVN